eukprot:4900028-Pyramimonas_sp.AAC.1
MRLKHLQQPAKARSAPLRDRVTSWWQQAHTVLDQLHRHRTRGNGIKQQSELSRACWRLSTDFPERVHTVLREQDPVWTTWQGGLANIGKASIAVLQWLVDSAARVSSRAKGRAISQSMREFREWVSIAEGTNCLFKSLRDSPEAAT